MDNSRRFIVAMAEKCRDVICDSQNIVHGSWLPSPLRPRHLLWMCQQILSHAEFAHDTKLHRWVGFVQAGILANHMLDLDGIRALGDEAKREHGPVDVDLLDHLDPLGSFELEVSGER